MFAADKAALFRRIGGLDVGDIIFRTGMTASFWLITGVLNFFINNTGAIVSVLLGLSEPRDSRRCMARLLNHLLFAAFGGKLDILAAVFHPYCAKLFCVIRD